MLVLFLLGLLAFGTALLITPLCRDLCAKLGLVDRPDEERKFHNRAVPRTGGIPVALAYIAPFGVLLAHPAAAGVIGRALGWELPLAAALVFAAGLLDDLRGLKPWHKLAAQIAAAGLACYGGVRIYGIHGYLIDAWFGVPLTILWLVACSNAFNLIDGLDGLAAGAGVFATSTILLSAILENNFQLALVTLPLAASLAGFLRYNFSPASIFLGDSGSLLVGFLLGCYSVMWSHKAATILGMTAPLVAMALPLLDTAVAVIRRLIRGRPIFVGDRGHIHHQLLRRGLTPRRVVFLLYGFCALAAALSLLQSLREDFASAIVLLFCASAWIGIQRLGYVEFGAVKRILAEGVLRSTFATAVQLAEFRQAMKAAVTADECWKVVRSYYKRFGFSRITLRLAGQTYSDGGPEWTDGGSWTVMIPLSGLDYAHLSRNGSAQSQNGALGCFADALRATLNSKAPLFISETPRPDPSEVRPRVRTAGAAG